MAPGRAARLALALALVAAGCAAGRRPVATPTVGDRFFVAGYHPYWAGDAWRDYPFDALDRLYYFELEVAGDGTVGDAHGWPDEWSALLERARSAGVDVVPTISMHDPDAFEALFASPQAVERLVGELVRLLEADVELGGLHLDLEVFRPVAPEVRDGYTGFVAELGRRMKALDPALVLSVFALAFDDDDVYDEPALGAAADYLVVQGYDLHSRTEARAGPVAALAGWGRLNWDAVVDRFLGFGVPRRKIVMAVPLYGYEWPVESDEPGAATRGEGVATPLVAPPEVLPELPRARAQSSRHGLRRDEASASPYYVFEDATGWRQGWFEDSESLRAKYAFVRERGLGGVALFPLAYGDAPLWAELRAAFSRPRDRP